MARIRGFVTRVMSSDEDLVAEEMAETTIASGAQPIQSVKSRERVHLRGEIASVTLGPAGCAQGFQADLFDGTGHITLAWMGRPHIRGVTVGTTLRVWGRAAPWGQSLVVYNPAYTIEVDA
ncbi:MAG: hypothetical protein FWD75_08670 [Propionibacteriaceae bacterium]|nr:hypothetical protein [Propionibacteriaceae bacterium]